MMNNVKRMCVNEKKFVCAFLEYCYCKKNVYCVCVCVNRVRGWNENTLNF